MAEYSFVTTWRFRAPITAVWEAIRDYERWPAWWPAIAEARRLRAGDSNGVGEVVRFTFRTRLPYRVRFDMTTTHVKAPTEIDGLAAGELEGTGRWRLRDEGKTTLVRYYWEVRTTRWWMNLLAPLARPAFAWNHDKVMQNGRRGLGRLLARRSGVVRNSSPPRQGASET